MTDLTKWHLFVDKGRQVWKYVADPSNVQNFVEKYLLGLDVSEDAPALEAPTDVQGALKNAVDFYGKLQNQDGHWANDYGGPMFLLPGLIIMCYITGVELSKEHKIEMIRYIFNHQNEDGGWGLHIESHSTVFGSALNYVAARILGVDKEDQRIVKGRNWLQEEGVWGIPSWGKFWLATLGLYSWEGLNPLPPELWMLPYWFPFHPGRFWCHCRMVYLPMCYVYGTKLVCPETDLIKSLKTEIYKADYNSIDWPSMKWNCSQFDLYYKPTFFLKFVFGAISLYEKFHISSLRQASLNEVISLIRIEDESTKYIDIGPVNKAINMLAVWKHEGNSENFKKHVDRMYDYLWIANDGMKMQGYNGSQLWDTAFSLQAIVETGFGEAYRDILQIGHHYLEITQIREDVPNMKRWYRHRSLGAWPFSTRDHGWPISDCTSEAMKASLMMRQFNFITPLEDIRYCQATDAILSLQNGDGGFPSYETKRGPDMTEWLNPSECFYNIMVDYSYVECTASCIKCLSMFRKFYPVYRREEVDTAIKRGIEYLKKSQRANGSWVGAWGVCVSYAMWYALDALIYSGQSPSAPYIQKACQFLVSKQRVDGGWGESFDSCVKQEWVEHAESQVVNTAWCLIALMRCNWDKDCIKRGINNLRKKQLSNGDWKQESISGVFNANCAISYSGYKNIFPIWAYAVYVNKYEKNIN